MKKNQQHKIANRINLIYVIMVVFAIVVFVRIIQVQYVQGKTWRAKAKELTIKNDKIEGIRGNIYAEDGSLLATSVPFYTTGIDVTVIDDDIFAMAIDSLAQKLSKLFGDKSAQEYKRKMISARNNNRQYCLLKNNVNYKQLKKMKRFPILRLGQFKGGFVFQEQNKRVRPFRLLASRTIGYEKENVQPVGLEGAYSDVLKGAGGLRVMRKIAGGYLKPINNENEIEPSNGKDIITTLNVNIQDVAESALLKQLKKYKATSGCAIVMEVKTGEIKAIANLKEYTDDTYWEMYNYAIGEATEPGSTFKLASLMVALEDGYLTLEDKVDTENGTHKFHDKTMYDSHRGGYGVITTQRAFELSSNVGVSKLINKFYEHQPEKFLEGLKRLRLHKPLGIELAGEGVPFIKEMKDSTWSGITIPWMSIGYEVMMTPLQILAFYNMVANDGYFVKPMFVKEIRNRGQLIKQYEPEVSANRLCSEKTIANVKKMLEGVVQSGTATNLKNSFYTVAGKTGTAQQDYHISKSKIKYQASFVGYFPADKPKYSCIVVVYNPEKSYGYYGNIVAGPVFEDIADKIYATSLDMHQELTDSVLINDLPISKNGSYADLVNLFAELNIPHKTVDNPPMMVQTHSYAEQVDYSALNIDGNKMPNLKYMNATDAIKVLESIGAQVIIKGKGFVKSQSVPVGTAIYKGQRVILNLEV